MNQRTTWRRIVASAVAATTLCAGGAFAILPANAAENGPVKADVTVKAIDGLSDDFIGGMDVSSMLSLEESGVTFKNADGQVEDLFTLLKESGVNYVRLRVWNDPFTADGQGYGGGNVNAARALVMAKRATKAGLKVLVDFHYSDFWADPSKQQAPKAWKSFEGDADKTAQAVYDYTKQTLTEFKDAGVDVGMVQVGNETTAKIAGISGWDGMSKVFSAGSKAVREVLPQAKVAIHFTNPEKAGTYATYAKQLDSHNVDYDVFASSYYPFWHGTTDNLTKVLKQVASTYKKDVMVAETSWAYTLDDGDGDSNTVPEKVAAADLKKYDISPQGQADEIRAVAEAVNNVGDNDGDGANDGLGVFYWEPAWVPVGTGGKDNADLVAKWNTYGGGWATKAAGEYDPNDAGKYWGGSGVDNQALFDFDGRALASLPIFSYIHTGAVTDHVFSKIDPVSIVAADTDPVADIKARLPKEVTAWYKDGVSETETVTWSADALDWIRGAGTYTVSGITNAGHDVTATITVTAASATDYIVDGGFENPANDKNWTITGTGASITTDTGNTADGTRALKFWADKAFSFTASQTITGLEPGEYVLSAMSQGAAEDNSSITDGLTLSATTGGKTTSDALELNGWIKFDTATVPVTVGADGTVTVAIKGDLPAEAWGNVDKVSLVKKVETPAKPDTTALDAAVAKAKAVDRDRYTNESLAKLDAALAAADVLLAGSAYTAQDVADVTALVDAALGSLSTKEITSLTVTPSKTEYTVGAAIDPAKDLKVVGNYPAGMGNVELGSGEFLLSYDFSAASDAAKVTVTLKSNPDVSESYVVKVVAKSGSGSDGSGTDGSGSGENGSGDGSDTEANKPKPSAGKKPSAKGEGLSRTGASVTGAVVFAVAALTAGGAALELRRRGRSR
ncbi:glycosyl hydrolase 53 family protein [Bifidobacterium sp. CP2]|uniref:glycosyl hydrolase 53 family protein n=1 Tax=Bifidobacterium sp. CP2 TaxID=2809025 RepID=UPI001BDD8758|nr:glycosyl hydrolase 53 family protein [Bifidobacterium sp. CP2]MBT1180832.1 glycosyl hydrolase 53 family protein [Bifidobacterium sp. CP2]